MDVQKNVPATEKRGGDKPDWDRAQAGQPLPELPPDAYPEPDSTEADGMEMPQLCFDDISEKDIA